MNENPMPGGVPDLKALAVQNKYSEILRSTYGLPSEAYMNRPALYFFVQANPNGDPIVHVMWGSSEKEALNRLIFQAKMHKDSVKPLPASPPWPEGMNGWNAEFSFFARDPACQMVLERWAKDSVKKYGTSDQTVS
jgi:hypothetical protein